MSNIGLPSTLSNAKVDTYTRTEGADTVHVQTVITGNPLPVTTGTLASATSVTTTGRADAASVTFSIKGTYSGTFVFEASDDSGTTWYSILAVRSDSNVSETTSGALTNTSRVWRAGLAGFDSFRVRCSTYTSGTAQIRISPSPFAFEPNPSIPTHAVSQSGTWTVQPGSTANTTPWLVTNRANVFYNESTTALAASATFTGTARDVAIAAGSVQPYAAFNATVFADQAGNIRIEMSNDNTTWRRATSDTAVAANSPVILSVPVVTRYYRVVYVNGATLQGAFMLNSSYTAA
jgi:hypothetical protein